MYNYPKPPPSVSSGFAVEKGGPRQEGEWHKGRAVLAFHWLPSPGWTSPFWGCEHFFRALVFRRCFPSLTFLINQEALAVETTNNPPSLLRSGPVRYPQPSRGRSPCLLRRRVRNKLGAAGVCDYFENFHCPDIENLPLSFMYC